MRYHAFSVIFAAILAALAGKSAVADDIPPANLVGDYGFSAVKPAVVSACFQIEKSDLPRLNDAYRCWSEADHAFCTHLHQRLALVVYTSESACWAGRQEFGSKP
jgi:hypothetical protein